jgi:predicted RNA-binding protein with RPS1 domain
VGLRDLGQSRLVLAICRQSAHRDPKVLTRYRHDDTSIHRSTYYMTSSTEAPPTAVQETPQVAVNDIGSEEDFLAAIDQTIKYFNDGDIVAGTIVKVDRDEVLLDIGYKTEGVIPSRELSIKHDVDPHEVVAVGDKVEALVLQKEDKEGRLILSKKRAQYERAWGTIEQVKEEDGVVTGTVIEVVKGGLILDIGLRGFPPPRWWRCAAYATCSRTSDASSRRRSSSSTRTATTSCSRVVRGSSRPSPRSARAS